MPKRIPLTLGYFAIVDDADFLRLRKYSWRAAVSFGRVYAAAYLGGGRKNSRRVYLHRLIMDEPRSQVAFKNQNSLDCRRENLTAASRSEIAIRSSKSASGLRGVYFDRATGKYKAFIKHHGTLHYFGLFATALEAADAFNKKARELRGDNAYQNPLNELQ